MGNNKFTTASFLNAKAKKEKITMLTAYDYSTARLLDDAGIDAILIGDSLGMVMLGYEDTLQVTMDDMIHHTKAVARGTNKAMVITDMPFMSYHISIEDSIRNAGRIIKEGCANAVKLEGGREIAERISAIVKAQIPVMGHLGLTPQSVNVFGGFKVQGKDENNARKIIEDALILQEAGAFAIVLECVPDKLAKLITEKLDIPTIGIGAGRFCDGQILVVQDMLGMYSDLKPKFVKRYGEIGREMKMAIEGYINDVKESNFPDESHVFSISDDIINKLY